MDEQDKEKIEAMLQEAQVSGDQTEDNNQQAEGTQPSNTEPSATNDDTSNQQDQGQQPDQLTTPTPSPADQQADQPSEKMIPQSQVNELIGRTRQETREKAMAEAKAATLQELVDRYGLENEEGLNSLFGDGQRYQALNDEYGVQTAQLKELRAENVLLKSGVDRSRFDDVIAILEHNHMEVTPETVEQMKLTHPEWTSANSSMAPLASGVDEQLQPQQSQPQSQPQPVNKPSVIRKLGGEPSNIQNDSEDERSKALKIMGL